MEVVPGLIVTATLDLRLAEDRLRVRCLRGGTGSTDEGLGLCAVGTTPSGGFCDRFVSMKQDSPLWAALNCEEHLNSSRSLMSEPQAKKAVGGKNFPAEIVKSLDAGKGQ